MRPLTRGFYERDVRIVARDLIGKVVVRRVRGGTLIGRIVETEAYLARGDSACHAHRGQTRRNATMFGAPGHAYVYAIHARWCLNAVTEPEDVASAVLVRALEPLSGFQVMRSNRGVERTLDLARGPGRLCEALAIDRRLDGWDLTLPRRLWIASPPDESERPIVIGVSPRIGVTSARELPLRYFEDGNAFVSGPRKLHSRRPT